MEVVSSGSPYPAVSPAIRVGIPRRKGSCSSVFCWGFRTKTPVCVLLPPISRMNPWKIVDSHRGFTSSCRHPAHETAETLHGPGYTPSRRRGGARQQLPKINCGLLGDGTRQPPRSGDSELCWP